MKLTIKNYKRIIGVYRNHSIVNAVETPDYYSFTVKSDSTGGYGDVFVKRNGRIDNDGDWIYHFGHGSHNTQSVTPDWFGDMGNAVSAIISEYETI
jgi:hypothetical protein